MSPRSVSPFYLATGRPIACSGSTLYSSDQNSPFHYASRLVLFTGEVIYHIKSASQTLHNPTLLSPCINLPSTHHISIAYPHLIISLSSTSANMSRPAKKRCQYKVVYNIPTLPKEGDKPTDGSSPPKPEMTANPTQCPSAAMRIAGDCPHCQKVFCSGHRTPESHHWYVPPPPNVKAYIDSSVGIQACRDAAFQANKERLEKEKTVNNKIAQA